MKAVTIIVGLLLVTVVYGCRQEMLQHFIQCTFYKCADDLDNITLKEMWCISMCYDPEIVQNNGELDDERVYAAIDDLDCNPNKITGEEMRMHYDTCNIEADENNLTGETRTDYILECSILNLKRIVA